MLDLRALPLLIVVAACARAPAPVERPIAAVVAAERAFSARAQVVNVRDAFVENFAPDAVVFTPEPAPAFPGLREGPPWGVHIAWDPVAAGAACSGELGWTTGRADYRRDARGEIFRRGYYSSVWARQADGRWKVLVDLGVGIPLDAPREPDWVDGAVQSPCAPASAGDASVAFARAEAELAAQAQTDAVAAFGARLHPAVRLHRTGAAPTLGAAAVRQALAEHPQLRLLQAGSRVATSGDLGYSYGTGAWLEAAGEQRFVYLQVWERVGEAWVLRLIVQDAVKPRPS